VRERERKEGGKGTKLFSMILKMYLVEKSLLLLGDLL
jgi:hypothetical protein